MKVMLQRIAIILWVAITGVVVLHDHYFDRHTEHVPHPTVIDWGMIIHASNGGIEIEDFSIECDGFVGTVEDCTEQAILNSFHDAWHRPNSKLVEPYVLSEPREKPNQKPHTKEWL